MIHVDRDKVDTIKLKIKNCFNRTVDVLDKMQDRVIQDPWEFADLGFLDQDIVDTGRLHNSKIVETVDEGDLVSVRYVWNPINPEDGRAYAGDVFLGFTSYAGNFIPGRDWPNRSEEKLNTREHFVETLKAEFQ
jgi:hypothetical protein